MGRQSTLRQTVVFTGGGSGGHVIPALTLIKKLQDRFHIVYIGSYHGIEQKLVREQKIEYYPIPTGKLRRYFSFQNIVDPFYVFLGILKSLWHLLKCPSRTIVFSTGGYVTLPVVLAAWLLRRTIFLHEQTVKAGLANKIASTFATKIFLTFHTSLDFFPKRKSIVSGYPLKDECYHDKLEQQEVCGIKLSFAERPFVFITGGGNGSFLFNRKVKDELKDLQKKYTIFHQVGENFIREFQQFQSPHYRPFGFLNEGMIDLFKRAEIILSRSGAGTVCELLSLGKRSIFIPLKMAQGNEQFYNALEAYKFLDSLLIDEDEFKSMNLVEIFDSFLQNPAPNTLKTGSHGHGRGGGTAFLIDEINRYYSAQ